MNQLDAAEVKKHGCDFFDLPIPIDYMESSTQLEAGENFGTLLPTVNQVEITLKALTHSNFAFIEVCEVLLRHFKSDWTRFRPVDRMVAHTGYLIFARAIQQSELELGEQTQEVLNDKPEVEA